MSVLHKFSGGGGWIFGVMVVIPPWASMVSSVGRENAKVAWKIRFLDVGCVSSCLRPQRN